MCLLALHGPSAVPVPVHWAPTLSLGLAAVQLHCVCVVHAPFLGTTMYQGVSSLLGSLRAAA